mmetsp:Transcript_9642/g.23996  ORF Transcript_9642/g.23996 Transcript_9642/m.23996 type:complete len:259 (+) Transcript_9642:150-926(+)
MRLLAGDWHHHSLGWFDARLTGRHGPRQRALRFREDGWAHSHLERGCSGDAVPPRPDVGRPRRREAHARDVLPASGRRGRAAPQRPLARRHGEHHRGRPRLLYPLLGVAARAGAPGRVLPVLRRRRGRERVDAPLRHLPALRHQLRPPLRRLRPVHRGDVAHREHALLQRHHPDGCRRLRHLHRVLLHGRGGLLTAARAPPEGGQGRLSLRRRSSPTLEGRIAGEATVRLLKAAASSQGQPQRARRGVATAAHERDAH